MTRDDLRLNAFHLVEASIAGLRQALDEGRVTSVELVGAYLRRIAYYDRHGIALNAVPVLDPRMFEAAAASDQRRREGRVLGPLDGIPYTAKDSYRAKELTVAAGSPAFERLVARDDAFTIERLRQAGARPDDHVSSPSPKAAKLAAVAVPEPLDEPEAKAAVR